MPNPLLDILEQHAADPPWPRRWLTFEQVSYELHQRDFWGKTGLQFEQKAHLLREALRKEPWVRMGTKYQREPLSAEALADLVQWHRDQADAHRKTAEHYEARLNEARRKP